MAKFSESKLISLLTLLSPEEYKDLEGWLGLPKTKTPKKLKSLYLILKKRHEKRELHLITKQALFKKLFPTKKHYDANPLNSEILKFVKRVESYLAFLESQDLATNKYLYFRGLLNRAESSFFFKEIKVYLAGLSENVSHDHLFRMYQLLFSHPAYDHKYNQGSEHLKIQTEHLESFFLEEKYTLVHQLEAIGQKTKSSQKQRELAKLKPFRAGNSSRVVRLFEERFSRKKPLSFLMFDKSFKLYLKHFDSLPIKFQRIFLMLSINDATRLSVSGQKEVANQALFRLYSFGMQEKLLFTKSTITPIMFNNLVTVALKLDKADFLEEFLWKRDIQLPSSWSEDAIAWAEAMLAYHRGQFFKVIDIDKNHKFKHWVYKLQKRVVVLKTYYHLVEEENYRASSLTSYFKSFKTYINREQNKYRFRPETYLNLINFTKKIHQTNSEDLQLLAKKLNLIKKEIQATKDLFGRSWLLEKIKEKLPSQK